MKRPPGDRSDPYLLWLVGVGFFMQTLDTTIVNTALPAMARSLGESPLRMQSVVVAYALTNDQTRNNQEYSQKQHAQSRSIGSQEEGAEHIQGEQRRQ